jgi:AcrR family transcriptional regulator
MSKRAYTLKRRAEQQAETRQRIVEAAVELHSRLGPARTPLSMIAERAGVQRHTLYAHFPNERSLAMACSGHAFERDPLPLADAWRGLPDMRSRLRAGFAAVYAWYARNAEMTASVLRDAEHHELVREVCELRMGGIVRGWHEVLGAGMTPDQQAMLHLMLSFHSWRTLAQETPLGDDAMVELATAAVAGV